MVAVGIRSYAFNSVNDRLSEYTQFGPAMNLEIGTSHQTEFAERWIGGPLVELLRLATLIDRSAQDNVVRKRTALRSNFSPMAPYELVLDVRHEAFDPASADRTCSSTGSE